MIIIPDPPELVDAIGAPLRQPDFPGAFSNAPTPTLTLETVTAAVDEMRRLWFQWKSRAWFGRAKENEHV